MPDVMAGTMMSSSTTVVGSNPIDTYNNNIIIYESK